MIGLLNNLELIIVRVYSRLVRRSFASCGPVRIHPTARIDNPDRIRLGDGVSIGRHAWLYAIATDLESGRYQSRMEIGSGTKIGAFCHITCAGTLALGSHVLIGQGVYISDNSHKYEDVTRPIRIQGLAVKETRIGDETWIGNHSVVMRCFVGKHCVVGANSVVTRDVPDNCVVAGAPARVIKRFNPATESWERV